MSVEDIIVAVSPAADWRREPRTSLALAAAVSAVFAIVFWVWERDLLWMLTVILAPIWSPVIYRHFAEEEQRAASRMLVGALVAGLAVMAGVAIIVFVANS